MYNTANPKIDAKIEFRRLAKPDEIWGGITFDEAMTLSRCYGRIE